MRDDKLRKVEAGGKVRRVLVSSYYFLPCNPFRDITYGRGRWRKFYERAAANNICHRSVESVSAGQFWIGAQDISVAQIFSCAYFVYFFFKSVGQKAPHGGWQWMII